MLKQPRLLLEFVYIYVTSQKCSCHHSDYQKVTRVIRITMVSNDRGCYNSLIIFFILHISTNLHQRVHQESLNKIEAMLICQPDYLSKSALMIEFHRNQNSSSSLTCIYYYPGKCHNELLGTHQFLALKYIYSDEVFLLPARIIPIRISFHQNSSLKTPGIDIYWKNRSLATADIH